RTSRSMAMRRSPELESMRSMTWFLVCAALLSSRAHAQGMISGAKAVDGGAGGGEDDTGRSDGGEDHAYRGTGGSEDHTGSGGHHESGRGDRQGGPGDQDGGRSTGGFGGYGSAFDLSHPARDQR